MLGDLVVSCTVVSLLNFLYPHPDCMDSMYSNVSLQLFWSHLHNIRCELSGTTFLAFLEWDMAHDRPGLKASSSDFWYRRAWQIR